MDDKKIWVVGSIIVILTVVLVTRIGAEALAYPAIGAVIGFAVAFINR